MRVKEYLRSRQVVFKEVDIIRDQTAAAEMVRKSGQQGVPQLWISGWVVVGFNRQKIDVYLGLK